MRLQLTLLTRLSQLISVCKISNDVLNDIINETKTVDPLSDIWIISFIKTTAAPSALKGLLAHTHTHTQLQ